MIRICRIIGHKYPKKVITPGSPMIDLKCLRKGCPFYNLKEYVKIYDEDGNFFASRKSSGEGYSSFGAIMTTMGDFIKGFSILIGMRNNWWTRLHARMIIKKWASQWRN